MVAGRGGKEARSGQVLGGVRLMWVIGLIAVALAAAFAVGRILGLPQKPFEWIVYVIVGGGASVATLGVPLAIRWRGWTEPPWVKPALGAVGVAGVAALALVVGATAGWHWAVVAMLLAAGQTWAIEGWKQDGRGLTPGGVASALAAMWAWTALLPNGLATVLSSPVLAAGLAVGMALAILAVRGRTGGEGGPGWPAHVAAALVIVTMSLQTVGLFDDMALVHWSAWHASAELVRQGGWLLWDVPSMYGTLSIAAIAAMPAATTWQAYYLLLVLTDILVAGCCYAIALRIGRGWRTWPFALLAAVAIPMLTCRIDPDWPAAAVYFFPNFAAYRYSWVVVLVMLLVAERLTAEGSGRHRAVLWLGCGAWLAGVLWGMDSAVTCTAAWLPAYGVAVWREEAGAGRSWPRLAGRLLAPVALLAGAVLLMTAVWRGGAGVGPDWSAALDYVLSLGVDFVMGYQGLLRPAMLMAVGFSGLLIGAAYGAERFGLPTRSMALWVGLLGAYLGANLYPYQRGDAIHPIGLVVLLLVVAIAARERDALTWGPMARAAIVPLLVFEVAGPVSNLIVRPGDVPTALESVAETMRHGFSVDYLVPEADPELQALLRSAGVTAETPLAFGDGLGNVLGPWWPEGATHPVAANPQWTPAYPAVSLEYLRDGRRQAYVQRFAERRPRSGWMIQRREEGAGSEARFTFGLGMREDVFETLLKTHVPTRVVHSDNWQLTWWEAVGDAAEIARPEFRTWKASPLSDDLLVNGAPLSGQDAPEVWAGFGAGWGGPNESPGSARRANPESSLWVYSPVRQEAVIRLMTEAMPRRATVALNGGPASAIADDGRVEWTSELSPGWNELQLEVLVEAPKEKADSPKRNGKGSQPAKADAAAGPAAAPAAVGEPAGTAARPAPLRAVSVEIVTDTAPAS